MSATPTSTTPASSSHDYISGWSADFDFGAATAKEVVIFWVLVGMAFVFTLGWLGFSAGLLAVKLGLV